MEDLEESREGMQVADDILFMTDHPPHPEYDDDIRSQCSRVSEFYLVRISPGSADRLLTETDPDKVREYAGRHHPPPIVFTAEYGVPDPDLVLLDGHHRLAAAIERGDETIEAWVPADFLDE